MCGDPIHVGHINILNEASKYGSVVVGLMTDETMISYKRKPITSYKNRAAVVRASKNGRLCLPVRRNRLRKSS